MGGHAVGPAAGRARRGGEEEVLALKDCREIRKEAVSTPPALIDALCNGEPMRWVCIEAPFVEELRKIAHMLNRGHLLRFIECE